MSWLFLFVLWPLLWIVWQWLGLEGAESRGAMRDDSIELGSVFGSSRNRVAIPTLLALKRLTLFARLRSLMQLAAILSIAVYMINLGYLFDGTGEPLNGFHFISTSLTGLDQPGISGNRFRNVWFGDLPVPFPRQYILGIDAQKKDFERFEHHSYLRGQWSETSWWYYYLYGLLGKVPCGIWLLLVFVICCRSFVSAPNAIIRDEMVLLMPAVILLVIASAQTGFSIHLRYVFPSLGLVLVFVGQSGQYLRRSCPFRASGVAFTIVYVVVSCMLVYPNHLAYFNEFVGGPRNGCKHLLGSSVDWGQGDREAISWIKKNEPLCPVEFCTFSASLANVLWSGEEPAGDDAVRKGNHNVKLILYSADYYSEGGHRTMSKEPFIEEVVKKFKSGSILARVTIK